MGRAPCCDKASVKKGPWSSEEDATLKDYIDKNGTGGNWIALPQKIGLNRCGKSCRLRWLNYLRPNIKHGGFTDEEDNIICSLYISIGSRWSIIAAQLPGRTDNDIKNYWNTRLKKKLLRRRKQSNRNNNKLLISSSGQLVQTDFNEKEDNLNTLQNLSSSALERLQLHMHLQNPFSFYNNPSLFPKLSLLQQNMSQNLNCLNEDCHDFKGIELVNSISRDSSFSGVKMERNFLESDVTLENRGIRTGILKVHEFDDLFNVDKSSCLVPTEGVDQTGDRFDCFKVMDGSRDNFAWWNNNEFDQTNSSSSNSWDSPDIMFHQAEEMLYQDYAIGYSMQ